MIFSDQSLHSAANHSAAIHLMKPSSLFFAFLIGISSLVAAPDESKTWTAPEVALREDHDFAIQGEYCNETMGAQVVALGSRKFDVYLLEGGLPGAGWEPGNARIQLTGENGQFSDAASKTTATLENAVLTITKADGTKQALKRIERQSPTLNESRPATPSSYLRTNGRTPKKKTGSSWQTRVPRSHVSEATRCISSFARPTSRMLVGRSAGTAACITTDAGRRRCSIPSA
jgi:hypothetical protein